MDTKKNKLIGIAFESIATILYIVLLFAAAVMIMR